MQHTAARSRQNTLMIGALGVVFGDIGTSPLYTIKESFASHAGAGLSVNVENVVGILSLIFWLLMIVVTFKYVTLIMRADNRGEGGILSLHALALRTTNKFKLRRFFMILGIIGAGLFYGESLITPAISVLSAVEGLEVATPHFSHMVVPITITILLTLFAVQRHGTNSIGRFFGPIMLVWFAVIGLLGAVAIFNNPEVLQAINPLHAITFVLTHQSLTFIILGAVVLCVTGSEAIYVDMGHFGRKPVQRAWYFIALPCLLLNYFGQGAVVLANPAATKNPFYMLAPDWFLVPLVLLATMAAVIASQATISGAFSVTRQAIQLGYLPRLNITHTSEHEAGQIYIPFINLVLMVSVVLLVLGFKSSSNLAAAYGISVTGAMIITTVLAYQVARRVWNMGPLAASALCIPLLLIDVLMFAGNMVKMFDGGWITVVVAIAFFLLMLTWLDGSRFLYKQISNSTQPLRDFVASIAHQKYHRVPGTGIFLVRTAGDAPHALVRNFKHNHVLHERIIILNITTKDVPRVPRSERYKISDLENNFIFLEAFYGFMELPSIPLLFRQCVEEGRLQLDMGDTSFFVSRITLIPDPHMGLPLWQATIYKWLHLNSVRTHDFYRIPTNKVLEIGVQMRM